MDNIKLHLNVPAASELPLVATNTADPSKCSAGSSCLVSHVPTTVSIEKCIDLSRSTNSSVSTEEIYATSSITRSIDDESTSEVQRTVSNSHHIQDSVNESSKEPIRLAVIKKRVNARKVSDLDSDMVAQDSGMVTSHSKKRKVVPGFRQSALQLLGGPEDSKVLNPLHVFVRMQVEVFTATPHDIARPAPGRKNAIHLHQVGLRCIHCKGLPSRDRVKRAVCYPSSVGRVYHSASDMKFDHFTNCRGLSPQLRQSFEFLKSQCKRRGERGNRTHSSTAQYYHDSARLMGMVDGGGGILMSGFPMGMSTCLLIAPSADLSANSRESSPVSPPISTSESFTAVPVSPPYRSALSVEIPGFSSNNMFSQGLASCIPLYKVMSRQESNPRPEQTITAHGFSFVNFNMPNTMTQRHSVSPVLSSQSFTHDLTQYSGPLRNASSVVGGDSLLASPSDAQYLNPLHCFVRRHVAFFVANKEDIAAPSPGRKNRVHIGQVGIRCRRCAHLPLKDRVKRAICYPPSISGVYHSISNMKFDHFTTCRGLSAEDRAEFNHLRVNCNRRGGFTSNGASGMSNSTAQYYHDSALRFGLVDTPQGIRFRDHSVDDKVDINKHCSDGISVLMIAATNPTVRAEYERNRAGSDSMSAVSTCTVE